MRKKVLSRHWQFFGLILILCFTVGCATTIPVTYTEPAKLNMSGVTRIAIKSNDTQVLNSITQKLTGIYTVATNAELLAWEQWRAQRLAMEQLKNLQTTAAEVSSADLVAAYLANAVRADETYGRGLIRTSGTVAEIGQDSRGRYYARINVGNDSIAVYFAESERSKLASVDIGQTITVIGKNYGFNLPDMEDTAEILRLLGAGRRVNIADATFPLEDLVEYPGTIDAVITINKNSSIQDGSNNQVRRELIGKDAEGKNVYQDINVVVFERTVTVTLDYQIVRARNSSVIGQGTKTATSSKSTNEDRTKLTAASQLEANTIDRPLQEFINEIVPATRTIKLTLVKPDNDNAKKEMGEAEKFAKNRDYTSAAAAYGAIYAEYGNFAAGYNQAILTEASQGTVEAIALMLALIQKFDDNPTAQNTLSEMQRRNAANQQAAQQLR